MSQTYYTGVPRTTPDEKIKEVGHQVPSSDTDTESLEELKAQDARPHSGSTLDWKSLITPIGTTVLAVGLAVGHYAFNAWIHGKPVATIKVPQDWVTRIGVGFSFGFQSAVGATMAFVLLQCLWLSVLRKPLTIKEIDNLYQIERREKLYKSLPQALSINPAMVIFSALTLFLPLAGVFAPGSLTVINQNYTDIPGPCSIPSGNLSTPNVTDSTSLFTTGGIGYWQSVTPRATTLTTQWFVNQQIPNLPQACGPNCRYKVSVPSILFQCMPNPPSLPYAQGGLPPDVPFSDRSSTLWNATTDPTSRWSFYVAWKSNNGTGTSGNASCSPIQALYDVEVQTKDGAQFVSTNVTEITSPIPEGITNVTFIGENSDSPNLAFWMQLASLSYATKALFLGTAVVQFGMTSTFLESNTTASQASFVKIPVQTDFDDPVYVWGDVIKGIEETSHNFTASLLTMQLGDLNAECFFDQQAAIYRFISYSLWAPYGAALGIALISLAVAVTIMTRNDTGRITTSFTDTINLTRGLEEEISADAKLRLRAGKSGKLEYTVR